MPKPVVVSQRKKLRPSNGNITICGTRAYQKQISAFGDILAQKLQVLTKTKVSHILLPVGNGQEKRLCLTICEGEGDLKDIKSLLEKNFNLYYNEDPRKPCLRVWGFPIEFVEPEAQEIKSSWSELFYITAKINRKGDLELSVSSKNEKGDLIQDFREEIEKNFPKLEIRNKQKSRRGESRPGFVIICKVSAVETRVATQVATSEKEGDRPAANETLPMELPSVSAERIMGLVLDQLSKEQRIKLIKTMLPKGIGLYNTENPLVANETGFKINSI